MATKAKESKETKTEKEDSEEFDGTILRPHELVFVGKSENQSGLEILSNVEGEFPSVMKLPLMAYDETKKQYVESAETFESTEAIVQEHFKKSVKELLDDQGPFGTQFEAYFNGERSSFKPIKPFIRYDKIETADSKLLKKYTDEYGTVPVTEFPEVRFNVGLTVNLNDTEKRFRVSRLKIEQDDLEAKDILISLKFAGREVAGFKAQIEEGNLPPETVKKMEPMISSLIEKSRKEKINEISEALGVDFGRMVEGDGTIVFNDVECHQVPATDVYYLDGIVDLEATRATQENKE